MDHYFRRSHCLKALRWACQAGIRILLVALVKVRQRNCGMMALVPDNLKLLGQSEAVRIGFGDGAHVAFDTKKNIEKGLVD